MNLAERPRFRNDLVAQPIEEAGQLFVDVTDPDSGETFRFYEVEYALACAMDGQRDVGGLVHWAEEELGLVPSSDEIGTVVKTLDTLGYLSRSARSAASEDVELGAPGAGSRRSASATEPPQVELGAAGSAITPSEEMPPPPGDELELGRAGADQIRGSMAAIPSTPRGDDEALTPRGQSAAPSVAASQGMEPSAPQRAESSASSSSAATNRFERSTHDDSLAASREASGRAMTQPPRLPTAPPGPARGSAAELFEESFAGLMEERARPAAGPSAMEIDAITPLPGEVQPSLRPRSNADADEDGPTNLPPAQPDFEDEEVSVDLSQHLSLGTADVKEAVRASKVMKAVDVPRELLDELDDRSPAAAIPTSTAAAAAASAGAAVPAPTAATSATAPATPMAGKPAQELPATPAGMERSAPVGRPVEVPTEGGHPLPSEVRRNISPLLVVLMVVALLGACAYYYWAFIYDRGAVSSVDEPAALEPVEPLEPLPPPPPTSVLAAGAPVVEELAAGTNGRLDEVAEQGATVATDDVVARFAGWKRYQDEMDRDEYDLKRYDRRIERALSDKEAAEAASNEAAKKRAEQLIAQTEDKIARRKESIAASAAAMDKLLLKAPSDGVVERVAQPGAVVKASDVVVRIQGEPTTVASFELPAGQEANYSAEQTVTLKDAASSRSIDCTVSELVGQTLKARCPSEGLPIGSQVKLD